MKRTTTPSITPSTRTSSTRMGACVRVMLCGNEEGRLQEAAGDPLRAVKKQDPVAMFRLALTYQASRAFWNAL